MGVGEGEKIDILVVLPLSKFNVSFFMNSTNIKIDDRPSSENLLVVNGS